MTKTLICFILWFGSISTDMKNIMKKKSFCTYCPALFHLFITIFCAIRFYLYKVMFIKHYIYECVTAVAFILTTYSKLLLNVCPSSCWLIKHIYFLLCMVLISTHNIKHKKLKEVDGKKNSHDIHPTTNNFRPHIWHATAKMIILFCNEIDAKHNPVKITVIHSVKLCLNWAWELTDLCSAIKLLNKKYLYKNVNSKILKSIWTNCIRKALSIKKEIRKQISELV